MILKNCLLSELAERIKSNRKKVVIYGAGMIGSVLVPYFVRQYELFEYIDCFIDIDASKADSFISIDDNRYPIRTPDHLNCIGENILILVTNSKFIPIIDFLNDIASLDKNEVYIYPIMLLSETEKGNDFELKRSSPNLLIPKLIHYCWFGRTPLPQFLQKCIASWHELCPDYEIVEWNENNYDINRHIYTAQAYEKRRFGFVSDMARLDILYENGGIYLDTDVMLLRDLDDLLYQNGFIGTEKWGNINSGGGCGFTKAHPMLKELIDYRDNFSFERSDGSFNTKTNGVYETSIFVKHGFIPNNTYQWINGVSVYPSCVFHPYDYMSSQTNIKRSTVSVHHFYGGWMTYDDKQIREKTQKEYDSILKIMN